MTKPFRWRGLSCFRALEHIVTGHEEKVRECLEQCREHRINVVRVFSCCAGLFDLQPDAGRAALPRLLDLAERYGVYVEVVALASTSDPALRGMDHRAHCQLLAGICDQHTNAFLEGANEPRHPAQAQIVGEPAYLLSCLTPRPRQTAMALGAAHGGDDESRAFIAGDYITVHTDRSDGDVIEAEDPAGWRFVRHCNELRALSEETGKPVVNDEPRRDDLRADKHCGLGVLCAMFGIGDTFHCASGLQGVFPTGAELNALKARIRGWDLLIPEDWQGRYANAGWADSAVTTLHGAVREYTSFKDGDGYLLRLGVTDPSPKWAEGWPGRALQHEEGRMQLWAVSR